MSQTEYTVGDSVFTPKRGGGKIPPQVDPSLPRTEELPGVYELGGRVFTSSPSNRIPTVREPVDERTGMQKFGDIFTGGQAREDVRDIPEFLPSLIGRTAGKMIMPIQPSGEDPLGDTSIAGQAKALAGLLGSYNAEGRMNIILENIEGAVKVDDNRVRVGNQEFIVNKDGFSANDAYQLGASIVAFLPASRVVNMLRAGATRVAAAVPLFAGTTASLEGLADRLGSEKGISLVNSALTGIIGGAATWVSPHIARMFANKGVLDTAGKVTDAGKKILSKLGAKVDDMTQEALENFNEIFKRASGNMAGSGGPAALRHAEAKAAGINLENQLVDEMVSAAEKLRRQVPKDVIPPATATGAATQVVDAMAARSKELSAAVREGYEKAGKSISDVTLTKGSFQTNAKIMLDSLRSATTPQGFKQGRYTRESVQDLLSILRPARPKTHFRPPDEIPLFAGTDTALDSLTVLGPHSATVASMVKKAPEYTLKNIERFRNKLTSNIEKATKAGDPLDLANLISMKNNLNDWLAGSMESALAAGDDATLAIMKKYPSMWNGVKKRFTANTQGDVPEAILEKLVKRGKTDAKQAINMIFGADDTFSGQGAPVLEKLASVLGKDSAEWASLQAAAVYRIIYGTAERAFSEGKQILPSVIASQVDDFLTGGGKKIAEGLFTKAQRNELSQLSRVIKSDVQGTAREKIGIINRIMGATPFATALGLTAMAAHRATGGLEEAIPYMIGAAGAVPYAIAKQVTGRGQGPKAVSNVLNLPKPLPNLLFSSGAGGGVATPVAEKLDWSGEARVPAPTIPSLFPNSMAAGLL